MPQVSFCIICGHDAGDGASGLMVANHFICRACEMEMLVSDSSDCKYEGFMAGLKKIWGRTEVEQPVQGNAQCYF